MSVLNLLTRLKELDIELELADGRLKIDAPEGVLTPAILDEIKDKKEEIILFLEENVVTQVKCTAIQPVEEKKYYALSSAQKRIYFIQRLNPESTAYNMSSVIETDECPDVKKLEVAFKQLINRHESLRTSFKMAENVPVQEIHDEVEFEIRYCEGLETTRTPVEKRLKELVRPFDLEKAPLFRVVMIDKEKGKHLLLVDMHHIISDGISQEILERDFICLYNGQQLPPLKLRYKDYAQWQNRGEQKGNIKQQQEYWLNEFTGEVPVLNLPLDYPRPSIQGYEGDTLSFEILDQQTAALIKMAQERGLTVYMVLLALIGIWLSRLSDQEDIIVGTPTAGRRHADLEGIIGMFANTLPMRNYPEADKTFSAFLQETGERTLKAFENQDYPFEDLVEKVAVKRDPGHNPLFDVMFTFQTTRQTANRGTLPAQEPYGEPGPRKYNRKLAMFDLVIKGNEAGGKIAIEVIYCSKLFKEMTTRRFAHYFQTIILQVVENPGKKISQIEIITEAEKQQIIIDFNKTRAKYPKDKTVHRLFEEQVQKTPDHVALVGSKTEGPVFPVQPVQPVRPITLTYRELNDRSGRLASLLKEEGIGPDTIVGIMLERSIEMIYGIMGILKAGGAYMPIDPGYPGERIKYMLADTNAKILITDRNDVGAGHCPALILDLVHAIHGEIGDQKIGTGQCPVPKNPFIGSPRRGPNGHRPPATSLAYVIYTSGTTGKPKGVMVDHPGVVNMLLCRKNSYNMDERVKALQLFSYAFDGFVTGFFTPVISGGKVIIPTAESLLDIRRLKKIILDFGINHILSTPSMYSAILRNLGLKEAAALEVVSLAGEPMLPGLIEKTRALDNRVEVYIEYGVTEASVMSTLCTPGEIETLTTIGRPIWNTQAYIFDKHQRVQPIGLAGELCIAGEGLARGYLNQPGLTAEKFDQDLWDYRDEKNKNYQKLLRGVQGGGFLEKSPHGRRRLYRTGDLARWQPKGNIEFLGRLDNQVKVRGFRIELGEIENQILKNENIKEAVVLLKEKKGDKFICAYLVTGEKGEKLDIPGLRQTLSTRLPGYMMPAYYIPVEKLPLTPNGKIDKKALPDPVAGVGENDSHISPRDEVECKILDIWAGILAIEKEKISTTHNFFELGGNSLNILTMVSILYKEFGIYPPVTQIYNSPNIRDIANHIKAMNYTEEIVVVLNRSADPLKKKKIFCFPPQVGFGIMYQNLANAIPEYSWYSFNFIEDMEQEERLEKYVDIITGIQPGGPYRFFGYSAAGRLAFQVAKALENHNCRVSDIIFWDCFFNKNLSTTLSEEAFEDAHRQIEEMLIKMETIFLKEAVFAKNDKYMKYTRNIDHLEIIKANVHLILSEDDKKDDTLNPRCWDELTTGKKTIYKGAGGHRQMFEKGIIEKNAGITREILEKIENRQITSSETNR